MFGKVSFNLPKAVNQKLQNFRFHSLTCDIPTIFTLSSSLRKISVFVIGKKLKNITTKKTILYRRKVRRNHGEKSQENKKEVKGGVGRREMVAPGCSW